MDPSPTMSAMREIYETEDLAPLPDSHETVLLYGLEHWTRASFANWIARHRGLAWVVCPWNGRRADFSPGTLLVLPEGMDPVAVYTEAREIPGLQPRLLHARRALLDIMASVRARLDPHLSASRKALETIPIGRLEIVFPDNARTDVLAYMNRHPDRFRGRAVTLPPVEVLEAAIAPGWIEPRRSNPRERMG